MNRAQGPETLTLTREQTGQAMLAVLNDRVGVRGNKGAMEFLADALGCTVAEARELDAFEFGGIRFEKRWHIERGRMGQRWFVAV